MGWQLTIPPCSHGGLGCETCARWGMGEAYGYGTAYDIERLGLGKSLISDRGDNSLVSRIWRNLLNHNERTGRKGNTTGWILPEPFFSNGGGWKWYWIRDIIRTLPPKPKCEGCGRPLRWWRQISADGRFCTEECLEQWWKKRERKLMERKRQVKCLRKGKKLLRQIRRFCRHPEERQKVSASLSTESKQVPSSQR